MPCPNATRAPGFIGDYTGLLTFYKGFSGMPAMHYLHDRGEARALMADSERFHPLGYN